MKTFLRRILPFVILLMLMDECKKEEPPKACGIENPHGNLIWLVELLDKSYCVEVYSLVYKSEEIIGVYDCPRGADKSAAWYKCDGSVFCTYQGFTGICDCPEDFEEAIENEILIYKQDKPLPIPAK